MVNQNKDSLRTQIIEAMRKHSASSPRFSSESLFDNAIMPVLDAAMKAGELLLHRATTPQKPVNEAIIEWLEGVTHMIANLHQIEATVSKRAVLEALYRFEDSVARALAEARAVNAETSSGAMGNLLAGQSLPTKG